MVPKRTRKLAIAVHFPCHGTHFRNYRSRNGGRGKERESTLLVTHHIEFDAAVRVRFFQSLAFVVLLLALANSQQNLGVVLAEVNA